MYNLITECAFLPLLSFPSMPDFFRCTGAFACVLKMQVKFPSNLLEPPSLCSIHYLIPLLATTLWSIFALWLAARCSFFPSLSISLLLLFTLSSLLHSFRLFLLGSLRFFPLFSFFLSPYLSSYLFLQFFFQFLYSLPPFFPFLPLSRKWT